MLDPSVSGRTFISRPFRQCGHETHPFFTASIVCFCMLVKVFSSLSFECPQKPTIFQVLNLILNIKHCFWLDVGVVIIDPEFIGYALWACRAAAPKGLFRYWDRAGRVVPFLRRWQLLPKRLTAAPGMAPNRQEETVRRLFVKIFGEPSVSAVFFQNWEVFYASMFPQVPHLCR